MARPDAKVVTTIDGYIIKKSVEEKGIFMQSPRGECFTVPFDTMKKIISEVENSEELKKKLGLE